MLSHSPARSAFTLLELLIVLAIIALLVALSIPAIQLARESSRRTACMNNLRQYGAAMYGFQSANGTFPSGMSLRLTGPLAEPKIAVHNYMSDLLVYLAVPNAGSYDQTVNFCDPKNHQLLSQELSFAICPSAPSREAFQSTWIPSTTMTPSARESPYLAPVLSYLDSKYSMTYASTFSDYNVLAGCENDIAVLLGVQKKTGSPVALSGMFPFPIDNESDALKAIAPIIDSTETIVLRKGLRPEDVIDGLSNTLMVVEVAGRPQHWENGLRTELREPVDRPWGDPHIQELNAVGTDTRLLQVDNIESLYSFHPSGVNLLFADGHVVTAHSETESILILEWMSPDQAGELLPK